MNVSSSRLFLPSDRPQPEISALAAFGWICRLKGIAKIDGLEAALNFATAHRLPERIKAAIGAGPPTDATLSPYGITLGAWSDVARTPSAVFRILSDSAFVVLPPYVMASIQTVPLSAALIPEAKGTPVDKFQLTNVQLTPQKVGRIVIVYNTFLYEVGAAGQQTLNRALLGAVSDAVDREFLVKISSGITAITSTGTMADLRAALAVVNTAQAKLYWLASPDTASLAATLTAAKGGAATAGASPEGGLLVGLPLLVCSGLASGTLALLDATGIAVTATAPDVVPSAEGDVEMSTTPIGSGDTVTPTSMTSLYATNSIGLRCTCYFACQRLRTNAISVITGITATTWAP
jgi:hypothetical protein